MGGIWGLLNQTVYLLVGFSHVSVVGCGQWGGSASVDGASAHVSGMILQPHLGWFWLQKRCVYRAGWRKEAIVYRRPIRQSGADQVRAWPCLPPSPPLPPPPPSSLSFF